MLPSDIALRPYLKELKLLCIDSSSLMQMIYQDLFGTLFEEVLIASDTTQAQAFFEEHDIHLVLCDDAIPPLGGLQLIAHMRQLKPTMPIILVTDSEEATLFMEAVRLRVCNFIQKPFVTSEILEAIEKAVKILVAEKYVYQSQQKQIDFLTQKIAYGDYQQTLSFAKELKMIRNDFYYRLISSDNHSKVVLADFLYRPKDVLSGDSYSARLLDNKRALFVIVDGMGKGLSASVSAMMSVAFINYLIDKMTREHQHITLEKVVKSLVAYMESVLLEEEILSMVILVVDPLHQVLEYSSFSMPPLLMMHDDGTIERLKSNNPPINAYANACHHTRLHYAHVKKLLIYSDGISENMLTDEEGSYAKYLERDFSQAISREDFLRRMEMRMGEAEDDMTFIFLNLIQYQVVEAFEIETSLQAVEEAEVKFSSILERLSDNAGCNTKATLAFSELVMNAYEHGNLAIDKEEKHHLLANERYFEFLAEHEKGNRKKIHVKVFITSNADDERYLLTWVEDEGEGFNTELLSTIFGIQKNFNGRGIFMSRRSSLGIYYNDKGNGVLFITKL